MNVFKKLAKARLKLSELPLSKSGYNKFANYYYFELKDFIPQMIAIFDAVGLCGIIRFEKEEATLSIYDCDDVKSLEPIVFRCPMVKVSQKGSSEIQNLGAAQTYLRRYLWSVAMELTDQELIDLGQVDQSKGVQEEPKIPQSQTQEEPQEEPKDFRREFINQIKNQYKLDQDVLKEFWKYHFKNLKASEASEETLMQFKEMCKQQFGKVK